MSTEQIQLFFENLQSRKMTGHYFDDSPALLNWLTSEIPAGATIGLGDSETLVEAGILDFLRQPQFHLLDKYRPNITREEKQQIYQQNFSADCFFLGANALSQTGEIIQIDGNGSRVAPMIYGPKKVYVIAGVNKLCPSLEDAQTRARQTAGPLDAKRLGKTTPCVALLKCVDCRHPKRICNSFVTLSSQFDPDRITVCLINKNLGY